MAAFTEGTLAKDYKIFFQNCFAQFLNLDAGPVTVILRLKQPTNLHQIKLNARTNTRLA